VLTQLFFKDIVSLKKCIMSEGCWFFTLKVMQPVSRIRDFPYKGFFPNS